MLRPLPQRKTVFRCVADIFFSFLNASALEVITVVLSPAMSIFSFHASWLPEFSPTRNSRLPLSFLISPFLCPLFLHFCGFFE